MDDLTPESRRAAWIAAAHQHGLVSPLCWMLDTFEPLAPLLSQMLWVMQPTAGLFGAHDWVADLADTLDSPQLLAALRQQLAIELKSGRAIVTPDYTEQESDQSD